MSRTLTCRFEFQHSPFWSAGFFVENEMWEEHTEPRKGEQNGKFKQFQINFIEKHRKTAIHNAHCGALLVPTNFVAEFWAPTLVHRLSEALRRPYKRPVFPMLKLYLQAAWEPGKYGGLCNMTRKELADHLNNVFDTKSFKPGNVFQTAYRLNLFSKRDSGPKPRKQTAGRLYQTIVL
jgi:hypothetical protein